jgi:hypothetical protein
MATWLRVHCRRQHPSAQPRPLPLPCTPPAAPLQQVSSACGLVTVPFSFPTRIAQGSEFILTHALLIMLTVSHEGMRLCLISYCALQVGCWKCTGQSGTGAPAEWHCTPHGSSLLRSEAAGSRCGTAERQKPHCRGTSGEWRRPSFSGSGSPANWGNTSASWD